ncbi:MAG: acyl carrier protein [Polyangiales bacterium]
MTEDELRSTVARCLEATIPEADAASLDAATSLRDQLDIDSMDMLRFVKALHGATKLDIPDTDVPKLETIDGAVAYLAAKLG